MHPSLRLSAAGLAAGLFALTAFAACTAGEAPLTFTWPPAAGQPYPELELQDFRGETVRLASFRGKVLLIEPIGMT